MKTLILFTADFPYSTGETFLENELPYLANAFDKIWIVTENTNSSEKRTIPGNCNILRVGLSLSKCEKVKALLLLSQKNVRNELTIVRKKYQLPLNRLILATVLISYSRAQKLVNFCEHHFDFSSEQEKFYLYSYWCDDKALGLALLAEKHPQLVTFSRAHGWDVYFDVHPTLYLPFRRYITNHLTAIFPISQKGADTIEQVWKVNALHKIHVSRLGVSKQVIDSIPVKQSKELTIVSCSNIIPLKRVELIAKSIREIQHPIHWIHFGDGPEMQKIKEITRHFDPNLHRVTFYGRVPNNQVLEFYQNNSVDVFINVSESEGIPVSIMEAMSFGIPVIATQVGGNAEIVTTENGFLLPETPSIQQIVAAIQAITSDESKREQAFLTWEKLYDAEKNYTEFIQKILND